MSVNNETKPSIWEKLQTLDRRILYGVLIVLTAASLFIHVEIPVNPERNSKDFYISLMDVPQDKIIVIESDWTNSTRGETAGHMETLLRIVMSKGHKFAIYSIADAQAPQVARDVIQRINAEREEQGLKVYKPWVDYVEVGYSANAEGQHNSMANDVRQAWGSHKERDEAGVERSVLESPVLAGVRQIGDVGMLVVVSASSTIDTAVERMGGKVNMGFMVTGVMGPNALPYYQAGLINGIAVGLRGNYDIEYMMEYGLNYEGPDGKVKNAYVEKRDKVIPPFTEGSTFGRGARYFLPLHVALGLMILAIILGNVAMFVSKSKGAK